MRDGQYGFTPLMYAAANGHLGTVRYLISKGAKVNARSREGVQIALANGQAIASQNRRAAGTTGADELGSGFGVRKRRRQPTVAGQRRRL